MIDINTIWNTTKNLVKGDLSTTEFKAAFENVKPYKIIKNDLYLLAPNEEIKKRLETRYINLLENSLKDQAVKNYNFKIILDVNDIEDEDFKKTGIITNNRTHANLNEKYTFETFVVGNSNRFAHAACVAVSESPGKAYNPLFLYGGVGLGKTHLMQAIGHYIVDRNTEAKVEYLSSEKFTNELVNSIKDDKNEEFRSKYRNVDVLLVDDIQFIGGKESTQEEFFHTFNTLYESSKQIIISSDRPPRDIPTLEERLRSRFEMGLITDIQAPDFETRIAILRKKAELDRIEVPDEVMSYIAQNIKSNIRELEGALTRVVAYSSLSNMNITIELASEALKDIILTQSEEVNIPRIKDKVSSAFSIKIDDFNSKKRTRAIAYPRQIAMYLSRELTDLSLPKIGEEFGGRDHTTVIHACDKVSKDIEANEDIKFKINKIIAELKG